MTQPTLSMQDIADLARVRRPVVSMWRKRPRVRGREIPFPPPVASVGGVERFAAPAVVAWLAATGRGNNTEVELDAATLTVPLGAELEDVVTLLCLHAVTGDELTGLEVGGLAAVATRADPEDRLLRREVEALGDAAELSRYVDDLMEASFGPDDALARVMSGPLARREARRGVTEQLLDVVCALASVARGHLGHDAVALAPPHAPELERRLVREGFGGLRLDGDDSSTRGRRRRAAIMGVEVIERPRATVHVISLLGAVAGDALEALDDGVVSLGPADVGIVLGPAGVLCEPLVGDAERRRAHTLRGGALVMALRLPRGQNKAAHRQAVGLWVVRGGRDERRPLAADLDAEALIVDDLASDLAAALDLPGHRAYRYARQVELRAILTGGPVVPRGVRAVRFRAGEATTHLDRIHSATLVTSEGVPGLDVTVEAAPGRIVLARRSLAELRAAGHLSVHRGRRVDPGHADPNGTLEVIHADPAEDFSLDPLDAVRLHPRATRTEAGDVVFTARPRPLARVDDRGGRLVASPSRVLRVRPQAPVGPHTLAAIINETAPAGSEWETWSVPALPPGEAARVDAVLAAVESHRTEVRRHARAAQQLVTSLIEGVAAGAVTVHSIAERRAG